MLKCGAKKACRANLIDNLETKWAEKSEDHKFKDTKQDGVNLADFNLNNKVYLATQQCGGGLTEGKVLAGILGLHSNVLKGR